MPLSHETSAFMESLADICSGGEPIGQRESLYRSLVRNVHEETLGKAFPIARALLRPEEWEGAVSSFMRESARTSPALWRMPEHFVDWAAQSGLGKRLDRPYLDDLLQFEWVEIEVFMMEDRETKVYTDGDILDGRPVLNPHRVELCLKYPIFRMPAAEAAAEPGEYHLSCFRHPERLSAELLEIGAFGRRVLELLDIGRTTGREAIFRASRDSGVEPPDDGQARAFLASLSEIGLVLGVATGAPVE